MSTEPVLKTPEVHPALPAEETRRNFIGGQWRAAEDGRLVQSHNPATGEFLGAVPQSGAAEVNAAVAAARDAFDSWRKTPAPKRAEILFRAGELLIQHKAELGELMVREMGKVRSESLGDVQEGIDMTFYTAGEGRRLFGYTTPAELPDKFSMCARDPLGVVAAITPWNFPLAIPTWKIMPALVAGNTVVFKPAEDTPLVATELVRLLAEAGLPEGVLNLVHGVGEETGAALVEHPDVALVSFTGSTEVGRQVAIRGAELMKRVSLEMGGKNAILVLEDADLDLALEGIVWSAFGTSGQRCTAASRILVQREILPELTERLVAATEKLRLGDGLSPETDVGPVINGVQLQRIHEYVQIGQAEGARLLCGGEIATEGDLAKGHFYRPTVFGDVDPSMRIAQEEIFGPVTALIPVADLDEAIAVNNATRYGLSTSLYTRDINAAYRAIREVTTGLFYINAGTIGAEVHLPFGGTRGTGNGHREAGQAMLDIFTEWKTVNVDFSGRLQRAQMED